MRLFLKFIVVGFLNTVISYILFIAFLSILNYQASYTLSYCLSIGISYLLNTKIVFNVNRSIKSFLRFPLVYLVQYIFGFIILYLLNQYTKIENHIGILIVIFLSIPLTFILSRVVLLKKIQ
ncbi:GtrA family protein [Sulfurospirillum sp.]|uniref:GtrA family protein n=1 Tax=Sulfurospirillum sp. TaxID=2053622 RepID=UPI003FCEE34B